MFNTLDSIFNGCEYHQDFLQGYCNYEILSLTEDFEGKIKKALKEHVDLYEVEGLLSSDAKLLENIKTLKEFKNKGYDKLTNENFGFYYDPNKHIGRNVFRFRLFDGSVSGEELVEFSFDLKFSLDNTKISHGMENGNYIVSGNTGEIFFDHSEAQHFQKVVGNYMPESCDVKSVAEHLSFSMQSFVKKRTKVLTNAVFDLWNDETLGSALVVPTFEYDHSTKELTTKTNLIPVKCEIANVEVVRLDKENIKNFLLRQGLKNDISDKLDTEKSVKLEKTNGKKNKI